MFLLICSVNHGEINYTKLIILADLLGELCLLERVKRFWFLICDWWISIRFVRFCVSRFVACDRPVSGNNRLACFEDFPDLSYSCHLQE